MHVYFINKMKFILLIFSFVAKHLIFKNDVKSNAPNKYNEFEGCDQRYVLSKSFTNVTESIGLAIYQVAF